MTEPAPARVPAWPLAVRLSHWAVAAIVLFDWVRDDGDRLHRIVGYVGVATIVARWLLAVAMMRGADRFAALAPSPDATLAYLRAWRARGHAPRHARHDPLGLWMVWLLWLLVLLLGLTGWLSRLDMFWGDDGIRELHAWLADLLIAAVAVHVVAVVAMSWHWRENLPLGMLRGRKRPVDQAGEDGAPRESP